MDDLVKKGRGLGKGTEFDKSRSKRKPSEKAASPAVDKKTSPSSKKKVVDPPKGIRPPHPNLDSKYLEDYYAGRKTQALRKPGVGPTPKQTFAILADYDEYRQEFNKKLGVKNRGDYIDKMGAKFGTPEGERLSTKYDKAVRHYHGTGEVIDILKKK